MDEFSLITTYFKRENEISEQIASAQIVLGIGDDAALVRPPPDADLVVTVDTLVEGVHFPIGTDAFDLGHKSVAVNLSDLAAMGAAPAWVTLSLTVPDVDPTWLERFSSGLFGLLDRYAVPLIGGDTCRGPLSITVQAGGWSSADTALRRAGARRGDDLYVTGTLGDAALGLMVETGQYTPAASDRTWLVARLRRPQPRVEAGCALVGVASAAIDLSDGLVSDLGHILSCSALPGAIVTLADLPLSAAARRYLDGGGSMDPMLAGGDDYELCFSAPVAAASRVREAGRAAGVAITRIGTIAGDSGIEFHDSSGHRQRTAQRGYSHFQAHG